MADKTLKVFRISGQVIDIKTRQGLPGLRVESWDKELVLNDPLGNAVTDAQGGFKIQFSSAQFADLFLERQPDLFFKVFQKKKLLRSTEDEVLWNVSARNTPVVIEVSLPTLPKRVPGPKPAAMSVRGSLKSTQGLPCPGVRVRAFDLDLRGEQLLGEAKSDAQGNYVIQYSASQFQRAEKRRADLLVRALDNGGAVSATSTLLFNAPAEAVINLQLDPVAASLPSEYERLTTELQPLLVNVKVKGKRVPGLVEQLADLQPADLGFLVGETGLAGPQLGLLCAAARLELQAGESGSRLPAALFYGLIRVGLPADLARLGLISLTNLQAALARAFSDNLIPLDQRKAFPDMLPRLHSLAVGQALQTPPASGGTPLGALLESVLPGEKQRAALLSAYVGHGERPVEEFWQELRAQPAFAKKVDELQFVLQLSLLTHNHLPLIQALRTQRQVTAMPDLLQLSAADWTALVNQKGIGVPDGIPGDTPEARTANYGNDLLAVLHAAFPTETVAQILANSQNLSLDAAVRKGLSQFLANAPDFELGSTRVDAYIQAQGTGLFKGIPAADQPKVVAQLKRTQRLFQVSTNAETLAALLGTGLDSAHAIARIPQKSFLTRFTDILGGVDPATAIYQRAVAITTRSLHTFVLLKEAINGVQPRFLSGDGLGQAVVPFMKKTGPGLTNTGYPGNAAGNSAAVVAKYLPNYTELFGSTDLCDCDDCQSALSPAAYMVDLLHYLEEAAPNSQGFTPYEVLIGKENGQGQILLQGRRPDLAYLPLTCENTDTTLPYIDLVNEVLESYIVLEHTDKSAAHDTGDATTSELDANPQYTNAAAYRTLVQSVYPFSLPYHRPIAIARAYLGNLGSSRKALLEAMQKDASSATLRAANAEALGITAEEYLILTGVNFNGSKPSPAVPVSTYYGLPSNDTSSLAAVPEFLLRTGIAYTDLVELLKTEFINPNYPKGAALDLFLTIPISFASLAKLVQSNFSNPDPKILTALAQAGIPLQSLHDWANANFQAIAKLVVLDAPDASCDLDVTTLQHLDGTALSVLDLSHLQRFIRLWRKLGWSIADLDRALTALHAQDITPGALDDLARIQALQGDLNLPQLQVLLSLWADIDTHGDDSLYKKLFLNKATLQIEQNSNLAVQIDQFFEPDPVDGTVLTDPSLKLSEHLPAIVGALRVSAADLQAIREDAGLADDLNVNPPVMAPLNLTNISRLYRYTALAKALKLYISDLISLKSLSGIDPFSASDQTVQFVSTVQSVQHSGLKVAQLNYLYRHLSVPPLDLSPQPGAVLALAVVLRSGLAKIAADTQLAPDPNGDLTRTQLALLFDGTIVDQTIRMLNGTLVYNTPLASLPDALAKKDAANKTVGIDPAKLPPAVAAKTSYDPKNGLLSFQGGMTDAERTDLQSASADGAYQAAVDALYQQPADFIQDTLSGFLDPAQAIPALLRNLASLDNDLNPLLLDDQGQLTADPTQAVSTASAWKFAYLLSALLPYLRTQLSHAFIKQTCADTFKLDSTLAQPLLELLLHSTANVQQALINDLLALATPGLSGQYFSAPDLSGASTTDTAPGVAYDGSQLSLPAGTGSAIWEGQLSAPNNGSFTFSIGTNAVVQFWLDDLTEPLALATDPATGDLVCLPLTLKAGQLYALRLEARQFPGQNPAIMLNWQSAGTPRALVPVDVFYPGAALKVLGQAYTRLQKSALLLNTFKLNDRETTYLSNPANPNDFAGFDLNALPLERSSAQTVDLAAPGLFASWLRIYAYAQLRDSLPQADTSLIDVFQATSLADAQLKLAQASGWLLEDIQSLAGSDGFALGLVDFNNDIALQRLQVCEDLVVQLGVSVQQLFYWSGLPADYDQLNDIAQDLMKTVHARYDDDGWLTAGRPLNDQLREAQRDALVAYLLPHLKLQDSNQLFEYFLIDVDMEACMETSRIKQALSSIQLFVQRCLMNLEERSDVPALSVSPSAIDADQWEWMQNYRVWEANREVFLYPENWIVPELRDDKSPFFEDLESELLQNEATPDNVEAAFMNYLQKLDQVAQLQVCATYWEDKDPETGEDVNILHVFARTQNTPHQYYYRQWVNFSSWTAWEQLSVDIEGDHLIPIIWNRRLHLLWPLFTPQVQAADPPAIDPNSVTQVSVPQKYWQIKLAWSEYRQGKWQPKQITHDYLTSIRTFERTFDSTSIGGWSELPDQDKHLFEAAVENDQLVVRVLVLYPDEIFGTEPRLEGEFRFDGSNGQVYAGYPTGPKVVGTPGNQYNIEYTMYPEDQPMYPIKGSFKETILSDIGADGSFEFQAWKEPDDASPERLRLLAQYENKEMTFLEATPGVFRLAYPHQYSPYALQAPFFYQDGRRSYFVTPTLGVDLVQAIQKPDLINLGSVIEIPIQGFDPGGPIEYGPVVEGIDPLLLGQTYASGVNAFDQGPGGIKTFSLTRSKDSGFQTDSLVMSEKWDVSASLARNTWGLEIADKNRSTHLQFFNHFHPYVSKFVEALNRDGISGLLATKNQKFHDQAGKSTVFEAQYAPVQAVVDQPYPAEIVDFDSRGAYSLYNWELFFHAPVLIAASLAKNQRFSDAIQWLQYVFNPTDDTKGEGTPARYWKTLPFKTTTPERLDEMLGLLSTQDSQLTPDQLDEKKGLEQQVEALNADPFQPHLIARLRVTPYQKYVVMTYIDNLIAWGDQLFRQDTIEAINEATQLYVMASDLLGPRPEVIPSRGNVKPETYADLRTKFNGQSDFPDPIVEIENGFPYSSAPGGGSGQAGGLLGLGQALYFCVPQNDKLLGYWDTVADRLFKIRNCMNIEGVVRQLALFEPPIDPGLLVQAVAQGVDLNSVLSDLSAPLPYYRFGYILPKAIEMSNEVRGLGVALLAALEKKDAEELALLRASHETNILNMMEEVKKSQIDEAKGQIDALMKSRDLAATRYLYYQTLLGVSSPSVPAQDASVPLLTIPSQPAQNADGGLPLLQEEQNELDSSHSARDWQSKAADTEITANMMAYMPDIETATKPFGEGLGITWGMKNIIAAMTATARQYQDNSAQDAYDATHSNKMATYFRRQQEWSEQSNLAAGELMQIDKQLAAANIREAIAERDLVVHQQQMQNAQDVQDHITNKYTNQELYAWMISDISATYFQSYQLAYDLAKKAERAFRFELGLTSSNYIQFGYWDSLRKGLLSGERLTLAIKQMERAYLDQNKREYEISKQVSLQLIDPLALITLKETGQCELFLPEALFDADYPGHYMRRIKSVSLTLPCVTGPYTSINCTLTLLNNQTRISSMLSGGQYLQDSQNNDARFVTNFASLQSIATSHAQNDSGLFELNFRDERYLPFEGAGAISRWRIELPAESNAFDPDSLTDVILHLKYTARDGGAVLKTAARKAIQDALADSDSSPLVRLFSAKHEFPTEWYQFLHPTDAETDQSLQLALSLERFPYQVRGKTLTVNDVVLFLQLNPGFAYNDGKPIKINAQALKTQASPVPPLPSTRLAAVGLDIPTAWTLIVLGTDLPLPNSGLDKDTSWWETVKINGADQTRLKSEAIDDLLIVCLYSATP